MIWDGVIGVVGKLIDKVFPDPADAAKAKIALLQLQQDGALKQIQEQSAVIQAEANGQSWLQRNWRPITMLVFVTIIANNHILYPYLKLFWSAAPALEPLSQNMWDLLKIGIGGYIGGRTIEKSVKAWKE